MPEQLPRLPMQVIGYAKALTSKKIGNLSQLF
jgi:hypothetical protein